MASTRDVIAPPIFAEDASTAIPPTPIAGVSYRDPLAGPASSPDGWPYAQLVNSAEWNQLMFQWSSLLAIQDLKGILGWSDLKDYTEDAIAFGSDGKVYKWLQESGPGTAAGVKDPVSEPLYWREFGEESATPQGVQSLFSNLKASATGTSALVTVTADAISVINGSGDAAILRSVSVTPSLSASGANGLDTGISVASTWYSVWVIWNGTTTAGLLSLSATSPTMPSGYTHKARVAWIRSDSTANKYPLSYTQFGRRARYKLAAGSNLTAFPILSSGTQGSTPSTWATIATGNFVPQTASAISVLATATLQNSNNIAVAPSTAHVSTSGAANSAPLAIYQPTASAGGATAAGDIVLESTNIYVIANQFSGSSLVLCAGWEDNL